jgi:hypothetical protein
LILLFLKRVNSKGILTPSGRYVGLIEHNRSF